MPIDLKPMRYAHCEGQTDVCYDENGRYLITCGSDGDVRIYDSFDDDDPESFRAGENVTAVIFKNDKIITGADNAVQIFTFPAGTPDGMITRFTASITSICYSQSGKYLAAGASDFNIKVVQVSDSSHKSLKGHEAPVLCVALDPDEEFLASASCDGTVKFWDWKEQKCLKSLNILHKSNDISTSQSLCRLAFQTNGKKYLAVPVDKEVKIYERGTWNHLFTLKDEDSSSEPISIVKWSPCGNYLATASVNGEILIWSIKTKQVIERTQHDKSLPITCLVWNPKINGEIAYTDNQGQLGVCSDVIPGDALVAKKGKNMDPLDMMADELMDDAGSETGSLLGMKKKSRIKNPWFDDEADDDGDVGGGGHGDGDEDDENTTDLGKIKAKLAGPMGLDTDDNAVQDDAKSVTTDTNIRPVVIQQPQTIQQQPFQPGSTPVHLMHRFMVWNNIGIVRCHSEEEPASIDIEFHDSSLHHSMNVINQMNHTMAALSDTAVLLACQANEELPSKLLCLHFGTWDRSKEWTVTMPEGEDIMAVAVGSTWAAVVTNQDLLRVFTIGGLQTALISLAGPVVCMSGHGSQLIVVYHSGMGLHGSQSLAVKLIELDTSKQVVADQPLPLSPKANLSWLGFSLEGTPASVDSLGVVRLLNRSMDNTWSIVANTKRQVKRSSDNYWVFGLTETLEQIRCVLCTGSTYPPTLPRPLVSTLPLQMPVCEVGTEKGQLEENYLRSRLLMNRMEYDKERGFPSEENLYEQSQTEIKQLLMKLFALSCKTDRDFRAREVCELLPDAYSVSLAIKYASRNRRMNLAQRLDQLAQCKAEEEAIAEQQDDDEEDDVYEDQYENNIVESREIAEDKSRGRRRNIGRGNQIKSGRGNVEAEVEEEVEERMEEEEEDGVDEDVQENSTNSVESKSAITSRPSLGPLPRRPSYGNVYSHDTPQRSNPFKVNKEKTTTHSNGGFFDNVEKEKQILAKKAAEKSPSSETKKPKGGKQMTLFSKKKPKDGKNQNEKEGSKVLKKVDEKPASKPKKNAFQCWLENMKPVFQEENPDLSDGEIMKVAMKQWRETPKEEKQVWEKTAKSNVSIKENGVKENGQGDDNETGEKKRKRNDERQDEKFEEASVLEEKENISKKVKTFDQQKANSKLAGFAFSK